jgi:hypothetical protein
MYIPTDGQAWRKEDHYCSVTEVRARICNKISVSVMATSHQVASKCASVQLLISCISPTQCLTQWHPFLPLDVLQIYQKIRSISVDRAGRFGDRNRMLGEILPPVQTGPGAHPGSYAMGTGSFLGVKRPGCRVDYPPHLVPRLKKEYSYTSTPSLGLSSLF